MKVEFASILKGLFFHVDNCMILHIYIYQCGPAFGGPLPRDGDGALLGVPLPQMERSRGVGHGTLQGLQGSREVHCKVTPPSFNLVPSGKLT